MENYVVDGTLSLALNVLPMGFSWAPYLAQHAHVHLLTSDVGVPKESLMAQGMPVSRMSSGGLSVLPYCDNLSVGSSCPLFADRTVAHAKGVAEAHGFIVHEVERASTKVACLGLDIEMALLAL